MLFIKIETNAQKYLYMKNIHLGLCIKKMARQKGFKATQLADWLGYDRNNIYSIFKRKSIDSDTMFRLLNIFDCTLNELLQPYCKESFHYIIIIETDELKMNELQNDKKIKIVQCWKFANKFVAND